MEEKYLENIGQTAKALYLLSIDMDYADYEEELFDNLNDLSKALEKIRKKALTNEHDYWRTFARCLDLITEQTEINQDIIDI